MDWIVHDLGEKAFMAKFIFKIKKPEEMRSARSYKVPIIQYTLPVNEGTDEGEDDYINEEYTKNEDEEDPAELIPL
uniref:Uncharacterized protein n=1 Tax=Romanomermis culicivorax TaxID=13658 RepID=A0A915JTC3_ROMCU